MDAQEASADCDLFLLVGSTAVVYPAADLPVAAMAHGAALITLNMEPIAHLDDRARVVLRGASEVFLPLMVEGLKGV